MDASPLKWVHPWFLAARPKTLVASFVPVAVGAALAYEDSGEFAVPLLVMALLFSFLIQIGTNFSNDYFDDLRGADRVRKLGPLRAVSSGMIKPEDMKKASLWVLFVAFCIGLALMEISGADRQLLWVGISSVFFAIVYTGGPFPLAYNALGDLFVLLFFGFVAVCSTHYVLVCGAGQDWEPNWIVPLGVGFVINNLLVVNNTRDHEEDKVVGKRTLVVLLGRGFGLFLYAMGLSVATLLCPILEPTIWRVVWLFPLGVFCLVKLSGAKRRRDYGRTLGLTAMMIVLYGTLVVIAFL